jgi:hypothetical protein
LEKTGLLSKIFRFANRIDRGRKGVAADGEEHNGRLDYENGIAGAKSSFQEAQATGDSQTLILAEYTFLTQELHLCDEADTITRNSLILAIQSFDDALLCLEAVGDQGYKIANKTYAHNKDNRIKGLPKDAFHQACIAHRTRLSNVLRSPGINMIEKALLEQRRANMQSAQESYITKQTAILSEKEW